MKKGMVYIYICATFLLSSSCFHVKWKDETKKNYNASKVRDKKPGRPGELFLRPPDPVVDAEETKPQLKSAPLLDEKEIIPEQEGSLKQSEGRESVEKNIVERTEIPGEGGHGDESYKVKYPSNQFVEDRAARKAVPKGSADQQTPKRVSAQVMDESIKIGQKARNKQNVRIEEDGSVVHRVTIPNKKLVGSSQFQPKIIRLKVGEFIEWVNEDDRTHFINKKRDGFKAFSSYDEDDKEEIDPSRELNSKVIKANQKWLFRITKKMNIPYYCFIHPREMSGTIIVE